MAQSTIQETFDLASKHHQAGRLQQAQELYQRILDERPEHVDALHYLGVLCHQLGRNEQALELIRRALALNPDQHQAHSNLGVVLHAVGDFDRSIEAYRRAILLNPRVPEVHNNLGNALRETGRIPEAVQSLRTAVALNPNYAEAYQNLGVALGDDGQHKESIAAFQKALILRPHSAQAYNNLGKSLRADGQLHEAVIAYGQARDLDPKQPEIWNDLGVALGDGGRYEESIDAFRRAIELRGDYAEAHNNLGKSLQEKGDLAAAAAAYQRALLLSPEMADAHNNMGNYYKERGLAWASIAAYQRAIELRPDHADAHSNLGGILRDLGRMQEALEAISKAIALRPNYAGAYCNLGNALKDVGRIDSSLAAYRQAIALQPSFADGYLNLGNALNDAGEVDQAILSFRQAITLKPQSASSHSNLIYTLHFHPEYDGAAIAEELRHWNRLHAQPLRKFIAAHPNNRNPDRRLLIGYVSPDFRDHVVGRNLLPLLRHHDHQKFEIACYAHVPYPDEMTGEFRENADRWRTIFGLSDEEVARQIRDDGVDILVDLSLHTAHNRLQVFARKPAPVQVTYLAYCGSSGLEAMDYRFSDPFMDPPGEDLSVYTESTIRLPKTYWCYQPYPGPQPAAAPALANGFTTFGCLNNFAKVSFAALDLWAKILLAVPDSRLIIHCGSGAHRNRVAERFERAAVSIDRLSFADKKPVDAYLQSYAAIDIALDPFPYGGGITTLDALWMGVPVVTLSGRTAVGRGGRSILSNLGFPELIATSQQQYLQIAVELAGNKQRINDLRQGMRARMQASPLLDAPAFARDVESAYRKIWQKWCANASP